MTTTNFSIPELAAAQAQKHVTVNEALRVIDVAMNLTVIRRDFTAPPGAPSEGDKYIPAATASGAWTGREDDVAAYVNGEWIFFNPAEGWRVYDQTTGELLIFDGASWVTAFGSAGNGSAASPSYSFASDPDTGMYRNAANELAFATGGSERLRVTNTQVVATAAQFLLDDQGTDADFTISKNAVGNNASLTFQNNFSTRAIAGLQANDNFTLKVSPNGSSFVDAVILNATTGRATFAERLHAANGTAALPAFAFSGDTDTGMYRNAANALGFAAGGAERFLLTTSQAAISTGDLIVNNAGTSAVVTVNKNAAGNDAGFTFQTAFTTAAQIGALGNNDFTIKVGASFTTALTIGNTTAAVDLPQHPKFSCYLNFGQTYTAGAWQTLGANVARHNDQGDLVIASNVGTFTAPHDGYYIFGASATYETTGGTAPVRMQVGLSVNGANPTGDRINSTGDATIVTLETTAAVTGVLKLTAGDTVVPKVFFTTNNGRVAADLNHFWGAQIA